MSQFRQFWIWGFKIGDNESISQDCSVHLHRGGSEFYSPVHHVIEIAALEAAQKEIAELKKENYEIRCERQGWMNRIAEAEYVEQSCLEQLKMYKQALKVAEDAIEREMRWRTVKYCTNDGLDNLREALNEIKKGLG